MFTIKDLDLSTCDECEEKKMYLIHIGSNSRHHVELCLECLSMALHKMSELEKRKSNTMSNWLDDFHKSREVVNHSAYDLEALANAFYATGNRIVAEKLCSIVDDLVKVSEKIGSGTSAASSELLKAAHSGAFSTVKMALAMVESERYG